MRHSLFATLATLATLSLLAAACSGPAAYGPPPSEPEPGAPGAPGAPEPERRETAGELPGIPFVSGPLALRVSYPVDSMRLGTRDRNFIFGSAGHGDARVWINGEEVEVAPNGAFLAYLPVPRDGVYRLRATLGAESDTLRLPVRLPPAAPAADTTLIVPGSAYPRGGWVAWPGERIEVGFRGTPGGQAWLETPDGGRIPLVEETGRAGGATAFEVAPGQAAGNAPRSRLSAYRGFFTARRLTTGDTTVAWPALTGEPRPTSPDARLARRELEAGAPADAEPAPPPLGVPVPGAAPPPAPVGGERVRSAAGAGGPGRLVLVAAGDTVRRTLPVNLLLADPDRPRVGVARDPDPPARNGDEHVNARPGPGGGPYHYTWRNGTELELTGERSGAYRVRLADGLDAWTPAGDVDLRPAGTPPPDSRVTTVRLDPQPRWIDVRVALDRRLPYRVDEGERSLTLSVYGATSAINFLQHGRVDPYVLRAEWSQPRNRLFRLDLHLASIPWGYEVFWGEGSDLVLRLRRPPTLDPDRPLRGLLVGIDAGHGGSERGAMGPTGFAEAQANLGIVQALQEALERRGARVALSRSSDSTVSLVERTDFARQQDVDLWVSVHNNAFPDGVDPWANNGTSVYYNHTPSAGLAWAVHRELLAELGLRDLGVGRADLHMARFSWAPAILTENAFMMVPAHEAFLKTRGGQQRIAEAHVRGFEAWLRSVEWQ